MKKIISKKGGFIMLVTLSVISLGTFAFSSDKGNDAISEATPALLQVETSFPLSEKITEWDEYVGRFEASNKVEVRARVGGFLKEVNFKDGQYVEKGQLLFVIDPEPFQIILDQSRANYAQVKALFKTAQADFKRAESLVETGAMSAEEYDRREQALAHAQANLQLAQSKINEAKLNLEYTQVKAPISGLISRRRVHQGNLIDGGSGNSTLLTTIVATNPIHFYFRGSESDYLKYARLEERGKRNTVRDKGIPVQIGLADEDGFSHIGIVDFVDNEISNNSGNIEFRAVLQNEHNFLEPGMFGKARIVGSAEHQALMVPDEIIGTNQSIKYVYVLDAENKVQAKNVTLGPIHSNGLRIIRDGISPTDKIIINNLQKIRPNVEVQPINTSLNNLDKK